MKVETEQRSHGLARQKVHQRRRVAAPAARTWLDDAIDRKQAAIDRFTASIELAELHDARTAEPSARPGRG